MRRGVSISYCHPASLYSETALAKRNRRSGLIQPAGVHEAFVPCQSLNEGQAVGKRVPAVKRNR